MSSAPCNRAVRAPALALLCASLASLLPQWARMPIPLYDPIGRAWRFAVVSGVGAPSIEIAYYGIYACAAVGGLLGAVLGFLLDRHAPRTAPQASIGLLPLWALCALGLAALYQSFTLLL